MRWGRPDRTSALFLGLAFLAFILFVTSYWWYGEWVVWRYPTYKICVLSNHGRLVLPRIDLPGPGGWRVVYPRIVGIPYPLVVLLLLVVPAVRIVPRRLIASRR